MRVGQFSKTRTVARSLSLLIAMVALWTGCAGTQSAKRAQAKRLALMQSIEGADYRALAQQALDAWIKQEQDKALDLYERCLLVREDSTVCLTNLVIALYTTDQTKQAKQRVQQALEQHPKWVNSHVAAATLALLEGQLDKAEEHGRQAIHIDSNNTMAMVIMARVFYGQGRVEAAKWILENATKIAPEEGLVHLWMGHVMRRQDRNREALDAYQKAMQLRIDLWEAYESYGVLMLDRGEADKAIAAFEHVVGLRPEYAEGYLHLAAALTSKNEHARAEEMETKTLKLNSKLAAVYFNRGVRYRNGKFEEMPDLKRWQMAKEAFEQFAKASKNAQPPVTQQEKEKAEKYVAELNKQIEMEKQAQEAGRQAEEAARQAEEEMRRAEEEMQKQQQEEQQNNPEGEQQPPQEGGEGDQPKQDAGESDGQNAPAQDASQQPDAKDAPQKQDETQKKPDAQQEQKGSEQEAGGDAS